VILGIAIALKAYSPNDESNEGDKNQKSADSWRRVKKEWEENVLSS
jgi:hypothetical protein